MGVVTGDSGLPYRQPVVNTGHGRVMEACEGPGLELGRLTGHHDMGGCRAGRGD